MKIIASTDKGYLIEADKQEVKEILSAVLGTPPPEISIGQKIPAIDYAATIRKIKTLPENTAFKNIVLYTERFAEAVDELGGVIDKAAEI